MRDSIELYATGGKSEHCPVDFLVQVVQCSVIEKLVVRHFHTFGDVLMVWVFRRHLCVFLVTELLKGEILVVLPQSLFDAFVPTFSVSIKGEHDDSFAR
jgi:hypothetical protein